MTDPRAVDQPFRRLFAGFDRDVDPPADLATRLRLRVLAEAELDAPLAARPTHVQPHTSMGVAPGIPTRLVPTAAFPAAEPGSRPAVAQPLSPADEVGHRRRRQPRYLLALEIAAGLLLLIAAAAVALRFAGQEEGGAPRLGSAITAVAGPSTDPQLLWERTDPDLLGNGDISAGDDLLVRSVYDEHKGGFLWWETYEYDVFIQALDRRTGEQRWQATAAEGMGYSNAAAFLSVTDTAVLYVANPDDGNGPASLVALAQADGSELWRTNVPGPSFSISDLVVTDTLAVLATYDADVRAFDLTTGAEAWTTVVRAPQTDGDPSYGFASTLTLDGDRILTLDPTGGVIEIDPATGEISTRRAASVSLPEVVYESRLFVTPDRLVTVVTGTDDIPGGEYSEANQPRVSVRISAIDRITGAAAWSDELDGNIGILSQANGRMVIEFYPDDDGSTAGTPATIRVLDLRSGDELWSQSQQAGMQSVSVERGTTDDGQLLIGNQFGEVVALNFDTGTELWRYKVGDLVMMPPFVTGGLAIVADRPDHLVAIAIPENEMT